MAKKIVMLCKVFFGIDKAEATRLSSCPVFISQSRAGSLTNINTIATAVTPIFQK